MISHLGLHSDLQLVCVCVYGHTHQYVLIHMSACVIFTAGCVCDICAAWEASVCRMAMTHYSFSLVKLCGITAHLALSTPLFWRKGKPTDNKPVNLHTTAAHHMYAPWEKQDQSDQCVFLWKVHMHAHFDTLTMTVFVMFVWSLIFGVWVQHSVFHLRLSLINAVC